MDLCQCDGQIQKKTDLVGNGLIQAFGTGYIQSMVLVQACTITIAHPGLVVQMAQKLIASCKAKWYSFY